MGELQRYINHVFNALCDVSVRGDDVERMAEIKATLRKMYQLTKEKDGEKNG